MKRTRINTKEKKNDLTINNGFSFPVISGSTSLNYFTTTTSFKGESVSYQVEQKANAYTICLDWLEFVCTVEKHNELRYQYQCDPDIIVQKLGMCKNPNFKTQQKVFCKSVEVCDIYSNPNNGIHASNEVSLKVANALLYVKDYDELVTHVVRSLGYSFKRIARLDIAVDGSDVMRVIELLNKYSKSHTIQSNNDTLSILPTKFLKKKHKWLSWSVGKSQSGISARVYDKTTEIAKSGKDYVENFWRKGGMTTEVVGRFELQLNSKRLNKYHLELATLKLLQDAEYIGAIFKSEMESWFKLYRVKKKDMDNHKKEVAIHKGTEIALFDWKKLPTKMELLQVVTHISNSDLINARNNIAFNLSQILKNPTTTTTAQIEVIQKYACEYQLNLYVVRKIKDLFGADIPAQYQQILKPLLNRCFLGDYDKNGFN